MHETHAAHDLDRSSNNDGQIVVMISKILSVRVVTFGLGAKMGGIGEIGEIKGVEAIPSGEFIQELFFDTFML